jgi:hypothetical protein
LARAPRRPRKSARTIAALLDIAEAISRESPIIVIEDVHWADPSTNEWLEQLAGMIRSLPALLVATMRPEQTPQWAERSGASILQLARLQPDEIRRLVKAITAEHKMPTGVVDAIVARADGIPIFAEELARCLQAMEDASPGARDASAIPVTLNEILLARLDLLKNGRETAQLAAAIGRDIPLDRNLWGISDDPVISRRVRRDCLRDQFLRSRRRQSPQLESCGLLFLPLSGLSGADCYDVRVEADTLGSKSRKPFALSAAEK